ncbi:hypothetical protein R6Q59_014266 [Mikania micrantha]
MTSRRGKSGNLNWSRTDTKRNLKSLHAELWDRWCIVCMGKESVLSDDGGNLNYPNMTGPSGPTPILKVNTDAGFSIGLQSNEPNFQPNKSRKRRKRNRSPSLCSPTVDGFSVSTPMASSFPDLNKTVSGATESETNSNKLGKDIIKVTELETTMEHANTIEDPLPEIPFRTEDEDVSTANEMVEIELNKTIEIC